MPIVPSRAGRIRALLEQLASERTAERDSAVAQLTLIGPRVVEPLLASLEGASAQTRLAALDVLERVADREALPALLRLTGDPSQAVALRAIEIAGQRPDRAALVTLTNLLHRAVPSRRRAAARALARLHGAGLVEALGPLVDTVFDEGAETRLRLAILEDLLRVEPPLPRSASKPLVRRLASSRDGAVAARAAELDRPPQRHVSSPRGPLDLIDRVARGEVREDEALDMAERLGRAEAVPLERLHEALQRAEDPQSVQALAALLGAVGGAASIPILSRALRRASGATSPGGETAGDLETRAALHSALAALDSAVALHDLRELIARHPPGVTPRLLEAAARVGNASLVPALARAATEDPALTPSCAAAYAAIARREGLRRSSAALRRVRPEHRPTLEALIEAARRGRR